MVLIIFVAVVGVLPFIALAIYHIRKYKRWQRIMDWARSICSCCFKPHAIKVPQSPLNSPPQSPTSSISTPNLPMILSGSSSTDALSSLDPSFDTKHASVELIKL